MDCILDTIQREREIEGYVIRLIDGFSYQNFGKSVAKYRVQSASGDDNPNWRKGLFTKNRLEINSL